jgi:spermidine synthase
MHAAQQRTIMRRQIVISHDNATGATAYWQDSDNQSLADRRGISLAEYIHALYGFLRQAGCQHVLMIGCGGGTLATMLRRVGVRVTLIDIDAASFEIARRFFCMPYDVECHAMDGVAFLRRTNSRYDAIVLDAFRDEKIPRQFLTSAFFALAKARLKRGGIFLANIVVADDDDPTPDRICRLMQSAWRQVRLLDTDGFENRNAVALAGAVRGLKPPRLSMRPLQRARQLAAALRKLTFRSLR